jgi:hypothetical protein
MEGFGHYIWGDGREYIGYYKNDKKHGFGKYTWPDKRKYIGYWENGKQHGYGRYIMKNGSAQIGVWQKGKRTDWVSDDQLNKLKDNEMIKRILSDQ